MHPAAAASEALLRRHFGLDPLALGALRVALGLFVLFDVCCRCSDTLAWYTGSGSGPSLLDASDTPHGFVLHRLWFYRGPWALQAAWMLSTAVAAAAFATGWRLGEASPVLYVLVAGYQGRSQHIHDGGDKLLRHLLMWSCFLPLDAALVVRRPGSTSSGNGPAMQQQRQEEQDDDDDDSKEKKAAGNRKLHFSIATVGFTLQVAALYWVTAARRTSQWWPPELSAVYYMLSGSFAAAPLGNWVAAHHPGVCSLLTVLGQAAEFIAPALLIAIPSESSARLLPISILVGLQGGIAAMMWLVNFQICSVLCMVPFLPPSAASWLLVRVPPWARKAAAKASTLVTSALSSLSPAPRRPSAPGSSTRSSGSRRAKGFKRAFSGFLLAYLIYHSLGDVGLVGKPDDGNIGEALRFNQGWSMFGNVATSGHWWEVVGELRDRPEQQQQEELQGGARGAAESAAAKEEEEEVDLLRWLRGGGWEPHPAQGGAAGARRRRPGSITGLYRNFRWERYFDQLQDAGKHKLQSRLEHLGLWLCSRAPKPLREVTLRNFQFAILPPGSRSSGASGIYGPPRMRIERRVSCELP